MGFYSNIYKVIYSSLIFKISTQIKSFITGEQYLHTMQYYSVSKKGKILYIAARIWMQCKNIMRVKAKSIRVCIFHLHKILEMTIDCSYRMKAWNIHVVITPIPVHMFCLYWVNSKIKILVAVLHSVLAVFFTTNMKKNR